jgi:integrase/recombinase XerC
MREVTANDTETNGQDAALIARYLEHVRFEKRLAARTVALYRFDLDKLARFAAQSGVALPRVQNAHVRRWVAQMHAKGRSGRGIALILSGWRGFYTWLGRLSDGPERLAANPVQDVRAPRQPRPLPKALAVDEAVHLADYVATDDDAWLEARDEAIVELLYGSGLRVGELVGLDVAASDAALRAGRGWIDLQSADVQVQGKGGKRRAVPLGRAAVAALERWLAVRGQVGAADGAEQALFIGRRGTRLTPQSIWQRLQRRSRLAGTPAPVHPHMLRHSFASHLLQSSGDLRAVQELLGHASIATTQVYTRLDFQHLAKTYDAAHPRAHRKP